jgi:hypothetical protein
MYIIGQSPYQQKQCADYDKNEKFIGAFIPHNILMTKQFLILDFL